MYCRFLPASIFSRSALTRDTRVFILLAALLTGCGQKESEAPPHYAFIGFENLSADPSLDWVARGASEYLSGSLRGAMGNVAGSAAGNGSEVLSPDAVARANQSLGAHSPAAPGISASRTAALVAGANHIIGGYIERTTGGIRITASEEDMVTHKTTRTISATASSPFEALKLLAREFSPQAGPPETNNAEAFRLYCTALQKVSSEATPLLEQAVALDPGFGRAWLVLIRTSAASGDRNRAQAVIARARAQKIAPIDQAWLDFEDAGLSADRAATLTALRKVSEMDQGDGGLARTLAESEIAAGNFSQAAVAWKRVTMNAPGDADAWNQLGYALCWSGEYAGALSAAREYARLRPAEANPFDSQGDIHYWFGKFTEAAASYAAAHAKTPTFLNGGELYKGAWAKFLAGDKTGADALIGKFREAREKAKDPSIIILAGDWLYRTGRQKEAHALLRDPGQQVNAETPAIRGAIAAQLAVWDLLEQNRSAAAKDVSGGAPRSASDALLRFVALPSASASEWEARATQLFGAPQFAAIRPAALGYALILDGKKQAAIPVWEDIAKKSPTDFFSRNLVTRLKGQRVEHAVPPDPLKLNEFAALPDKL